MPSRALYATTTLLLLAGCGATPTPATSGKAPETTTTRQATPAPTTETPSPDPTTTAPLTIELACGQPATPVYVPLSAEGRPALPQLWSQHVTCDAGSAIARLPDTFPVTTPLQQAVVAAYDPQGTEPEHTLYSAYQLCASNDPTGYYSTPNDLSPDQIKEVNALLLLCPDHPNAVTWSKNIARGQAAAKALANGTRVFDGTYRVPEQMKRGTFVVHDVLNCYWETRDAAGKILANDFVTAAPQVRVTLDSRAAVFTARGCGQWDRA